MLLQIGELSTGRVSSRQPLGGGMLLGAGGAPEGAHDLSVCDRASAMIHASHPAARPGAVHVRLTKSRRHSINLL